MINQIVIQISNVIQLLTLGFTRIEVWSSVDQGNSFQELTSSTVESAALTSLVAQTTFQMGGKLLKVSVDSGPEQSINFSSVLTYWTPTQVADQINTVVASLATVVGGSVVLTSPTTGRASSVSITYSDAHDLFNAGDHAFGTDGRIIINSSENIYVYTDLSGGPNDVYKYRFSNNGAAPISNFSDQVLPSSPSPISTVFGTGTFVDVAGRPTKVRLIIGMVSIPAKFVGVTVTRGNTIIVDSDDDGFLQQALVPGITVRVAIEGTNIVREFVVPVLDFDFLTIMGTADDPFTIQIPEPLLTRRSI